MEKSLYYYRAKVIYVYDGDTITVDVDLGMKIFVHGEKIRLNRINTPELRGDERPEGLKARDFLRGKIMDRDIYVETVKDEKGKYGRYLGEIWLPGENGELVNINDLLVSEGFAEYKSY